MIPHVCPVCSGNGLVPYGFYNQTSGNWTGSSAMPYEKCRACEGRGIVFMAGEYFEGAKPLDPEAQRILNETFKKSLKDKPTNL